MKAINAGSGAGSACPLLRLLDANLVSGRPSCTARRYSISVARLVLMPRGNAKGARRTNERALARLLPVKIEATENQKTVADPAGRIRR